MQLPERCVPYPKPRAPGPFSEINPSTVFYSVYVPSDGLGLGAFPKHVVGQPYEYVPVPHAGKGTAVTIESHMRGFSSIRCARQTAAAATLFAALSVGSERGAARREDAAVAQRL